MTFLCVRACVWLSRTKRERTLKRRACPSHDNLQAQTEQEKRGGPGNGSYTLSAQKNVGAFKIIVGGIKSVQHFS